MDYYSPGHNLIKAEGKPRSEVERTVFSHHFLPPPPRPPPPWSYYSSRLIHGFQLDAKLCIGCHNEILAFRLYTRRAHLFFFLVRPFFFKLQQTLRDIATIDPLQFLFGSSRTLGRRLPGDCGRFGANYYTTASQKGPAVHLFWHGSDVGHCVYNKRGMRRSKAILSVVEALYDGTPRLFHDLPPAECQRRRKLFPVSLPFLLSIFPLSLCLLLSPSVNSAVSLGSQGDFSPRRTSIQT